MLTYQNIFNLYSLTNKVSLNDQIKIQLQFIQAGLYVYNPPLHNKTREHVEVMQPFKLNQEQQQKRKPN